MSRKFNEFISPITHKKFIIDTGIVTHEKFK